MPNIKPLNDRVLIERIEVSDTTAGGIVLPDSAKEKPTEGRIVAAGDGELSPKSGHRLPLSVKVGDRVLFSSYAGTAVKDGGAEYLILEEREILAVVDDKPFPTSKAGGKKSGGKKSAGSKKKKR